MTAKEIPDYPDTGEVFNSLTLPEEVNRIVLSRGAGYMVAFDPFCSEINDHECFVIYDYSLLAN